MRKSSVKSILIPDVESLTQSRKAAKMRAICGKNLRKSLHEEITKEVIALE
jgi:hypothetical protein